MSRLKRVSHVSIFLLIVLVVKSLLSILLRTLIASRFGAGTETDAYYAAFSIPQQLSDFFIGGILFAAIIPVFQKRREEAGEKEASKEISALINLSLATFLLFSVAYFIMTPVIVRAVFSGFDSEKQELTIKYSRLFTPIILLFGLSLIYSSIYHSLRDFLVPSFSALVYPASSVVSILIMPSSSSMKWLIYGNLVGASAGMAILIIFINKRVPWRFSWSRKNPLINSTVNLSWPVLLENLFLKAAYLVRNWIISILPLNGALTFIEFSLFMVHSVSVFIAGPISTAIFPLFGEQEAQNKKGELLHSFQKALKLIFFLVLPIKIIILMEANSIVKLLFGYGKFTDAECAITRNLLIISSFVIVANSIQSISGRMFFVLHYTKIPSLVSSVLLIPGVIVCYFSAKFFGIYGFMIAAVAGTCVSTASNFVILTIKLRNVFDRKFLRSLFKSTSSGILMALFLLFMKLILAQIPMPLVATFTIISASGIGVYLASSHILQIDELNVVYYIFRKKISNEN